MGGGGGVQSGGILGTRIQQLEAQAGDQSRVQRVAEVRGKPIQSWGRWGGSVWGDLGDRIQQLEAQAGDHSRVQRVAEVRGKPIVWGGLGVGGEQHMIETNQMRTCLQQLEAQAGDQSRVQRVAEVRGEPIQSWGVGGSVCRDLGDPYTVRGSSR